MYYRGFVDTQYAIGDLVRVVDNIAEIARDPEHIGCIGYNMQHMGGREFIVEDYRYMGNGLKVVWDGAFYWLDDWLEPVYDVEVSEKAIEDLWGG